MRINIAPDDLKKDSSEASGPRIRKRKHVIQVPTKKAKRMPTEAVKTDASHYQELLQSLYDAVIVADLDGNIVDVNVRAIDFLGYKRADLLLMSILDIVSNSDERLIEQLRENVQAERFTLIQAHCLREDETLFPGEIAVTHLNLDDVFLCFYIRDITIRKEQEEQLLTEHNAIMNSTNGIAIVDTEAIIEFINPAVHEVWGYESAEDMLDASIYDIFVDPLKAEEIIGGVLESGDSWAGELLARRGDGAELSMQVAASANRDPEGQLIGLVLSFQDISDRKLAEEAQRQSEQQRVMLESFGAACHHLGQPATVIMANLGIMEKQMEGQDSMVVELMKVTVEAAETLANVLHKLNTVNEYRTTKYLDRGDDESAENRIIEI